MLFVAEVIYPSPEALKSWRDRGYLVDDTHLICDKCKIAYPDDEYRVLFDNKKLVYFYFAVDGDQKLFQICHDCLFKRIKKLSNGEEADLVIFGKDSNYHCKLYPEGDESEGPDFLFP